MKKLIIILILLTATINIVNADISCEVTTISGCSGTIILGVLNDTGGYHNAHAQLASIGTYDNVICCNADLISQDLTNTCTDDGAVFVRLSSQTNAHVEVPTQDNYPYESCISVTNRKVQCGVYENTCPEDAECIYSLASSEDPTNLSNAHISAACDSAYITRVCCGFDNAPPELVQVYIQPNQTVYSNYTLQGFCQAQDSDLDDVRYHYTWYLNGTQHLSGVTSFTTQNTLINVNNISNTQTQKSQEWILNCIADDGQLNSTPMNSSTVTIINHPPKQPLLLNPEDGDDTYTNRYIFYNWTIPIDHDNDPLTYELIVARDEALTIIVTNETGLTQNNYTEILPQDFGTYYWRVRAFDGEEYSEWSNISNFTLVQAIIITPIVNEINFGTLQLDQQLNTTSNNPEPLLFRNDGNIEADLRNITSTQSLWETQTLNTSFFMLRPRTGNFNESQSITNWINISQNTPNVIKDLNWQSPTNNITFDISITVPSAEPPGTKESEINFIWGIAQ
ncbi:MAG: hypothetical protein ACMXX9_01500 [Candidatus Woesearchaeota archaeon]